MGVGFGERTELRDCSAGRAEVMVSNWASVMKPRSARASSSLTRYQYHRSNFTCGTSEKESSRLNVTYIFDDA